MRTHLTPQASIATRTTLRDDRETSLMAARADWEDISDLRNNQEDISKIGIDAAFRRRPGEGRAHNRECAGLCRVELQLDSAIDIGGYGSRPAPGPQLSLTIRRDVSRPPLCAPSVQLHKFGALHNIPDNYG